MIRERGLGIEERRSESEESDLKGLNLINRYEIKPL
uniref:Uncharacterized protein n=1 Tax=Cucumis melo TaxID=3656 RepID=A0A9I9E0U6_CUCME